MKLPTPVIDALVGAEEALDRLKLRYKERFRRFDPARVVPYRGFGTPTLLRLQGRVMEDTETGFQPGAGMVARIRNTIRRLETDEIRHARLRATFGEVEVELQADGEAFFHLRLEPAEPVAPGWHEVRLEIVSSMAHEDTGPVTGEVLVPPPDADFVVVSDLDDTVLRTGAMRKAGMFTTVLLNDAHSRLPFDGVTALYHALRRGPGGDGDNPFFYLSRSPWNLYDMLAGFLEHHDLPRGPLLLKEYGLRGILGGEREQDEGYKRSVLDDLMDLYPALDFVLVGDSGQHDAEVYAQLAHDRPERIRAIVIRDVTKPERDREVRALAEGVRASGVPMLLVEESASAAREMVDLGLLQEDCLDEIEASRSSDTSRPSALQRLLGGGGGD